MMNKCSIWMIIVCFVLSMINIPPVSAAVDDRPEILVLHSYSPDYEWTRTEQLGIDNVLKPLNHQYRMRIEYMDSNNSPQLLKGPFLQDLYKDKFANSHFRTIIASDNAAFDFLRQYRDEIFPGVPVIFCGVNGYEESMIEGLEGFTGITEDNDFLGLFTIISNLHPDLRRIIIYGNPNDPTHIANAALIKKLLINFYPIYQIEIREFPHLDACIEDAKGLPHGSAILMVGNMCTAKGEGINLQRANEIMSEAINVPIYTAWDFGIPHGTVGGLVLSGFNQGKLAAQMALQILEGQMTQNLPVSRNAGNIYMFDYSQMTRFNINIKSLPPESVLVNSPDTTYKVSREIIWAGMFFLGFLSISVFILTRNSRQRKKAEAALLTSEEKFSKAFKHCADIIGIASLDDERYIEVSETFFHTFGYTREEIIGKISTDINPKNSHASFFPLWHDMEQRNNLFASLKANGLIKNLEVYWCTKSGEIRIGLYSAEVIEIGGIACIVYAWHDITTRKYAEEELQQAYAHLEVKVEKRTHELLSLNQELIAMNEELQRTNWELGNEISVRLRIEKELSNTNLKLTQAIDELHAMQAYLVETAKMAALGNLVAGIAHEINTPVGVGLTASSHLQELTKEFEQLCMHGTPLRQDLVDYLKELQETSTLIFKNLERAGKLIQNFKQVSADQCSEIGRVFNVKKYLEEIIFSIQPHLKKTNHRITLECDETLAMDGFPGALSQIITNLIMNSIVHAYSPEDHGHIIISAKIEERNIIILYTDDGKGMNYNVLSKIFDPFYTTKRGYGGTGLGLHVVYNIVTQQFKGTIHCESQPGQGTAFRICFPLLKEDVSNGIS